MGGLDVHSGPTPRGRVDSEDRVSAAHPEAAAKEKSSRYPGSSIIGGRDWKVVCFGHVEPPPPRFVLVLKKTRLEVMLAKPLQGPDPGHSRISRMRRTSSVGSVGSVSWMSSTSRQ